VLDREPIVPWAAGVLRQGKKRLVEKLCEVDLPVTGEPVLSPQLDVTRFLDERGSSTDSLVGRATDLDSEPVPGRS